MGATVQRCPLRCSAVAQCREEEGMARNAIDISAAEDNLLAPDGAGATLGEGVIHVQHWELLGGGRMLLILTCLGRASRGSMWTTSRRLDVRV